MEKWDNSKSRSVQFFFFAPARILNVSLKKNSQILGANMSTRALFHDEM